MFIYIFSIVLGLANAHADVHYRITVNGQSCAEILSPPKTEPAQYTQLDYVMSDLEGLFYIYIQKLQGADDVEASRTDSFLKDLLSMKAEILNEVVSLLPFVLNADIDEAKQGRMVNSIYQIVDSMGIPTSVYGLSLDEHGNVVSPNKKKARKKSAPTPAVKISPNKRTIGFIAGSGPASDLPENLHRSIGFKAHEIRGEAPPLRSTGEIKRVLTHGETSLVITDGETGKVYSIPLTRLLLMEAQLDGQKIKLEFNPDISEWIIAVENLNNPSGRIGF